MKHKLLSILVLGALLLSAASCSAPAAAPAAAPSETQSGAAAPAAGYKFGYVLHGLNDFTNVIKKGAEDAGAALGDEVEIAAPSSFEQPTEAQGLFDAMIEKGKDGMAVVPNPGDVWVQTLDAAAGKLPVPVMTSNVPSLDAQFGAWFGQDEYASGVILATELRKILEASGVTEGKIVAGVCAPGVSVLTDRYNGFVKGMEGSKFAVSEPYDATHEVTTNYSAWENLASANPDMVAAVGFCSIDVPNIAKLKERAGAKWAVGGYDLNVETLDAIKSGAAQITVGQHPYLQGYLPILALQLAKEGKFDPSRQWVNVGTEVVTAENVDTLYKRESDPAFMTEWYKDYIAKNFGDLSSMAVPIEKMNEHGQ